MADPLASRRSAYRADPDDDPEKTAILKPGAAALAAAAPAAPRLPILPLALGAGTIAIAGLVVAWLLFAPARHTPATPAPTAAAPATAAVTPPSYPAIRSATEAEIANHRTDRLTVFRMADNPRIIVLDYPNLTEQGQALNRMAAFVEKAAAPRDRVLDDEALAREIAQAGDTADTYYYGHDYRVSDMLRFFALAKRDGVTLNTNEHALRALIDREGLADPALPHAIITVSQISGDVVDAVTRRVILRHELSHGEYFTNPTYAAYVRQAWATLLTDAERDAFRRYLSEQAYDVGNADLVANEMQAFLVFTPDDRYISDERLGVPAGTLRSLRERFVAGMPEGWLKVLANTTLP